MAACTSAHSCCRRASSAGRSSIASSRCRNSSSAHTRPSRRPRLVVDARARRTGVELGQAVVGGGRARGTPTAGTGGRAAGTPPRCAASTACRYARRYASYAEQLRRVVVQPRAPERVAVARAQQARGHVGAFEAATDREEPPAVVAAHRGVDDPVARGGAVAHPAEELVAGRTGARPRTAADLAVGGVERLPQLRRQRLASAARVLPRRADGARDRARERRGPAPASAVTVAAFGSPPIASGSAPIASSSARAHRALVGATVLEQEVVVDVEQARGVLGPLDVAADPVQRLGDAAQHGRLAAVLAAAAAASPARAAGRGRGPTSASVAARRARRQRAARPRDHGRPRRAPRCPSSRRPGSSSRSGCAPGARRA